MSTQETPKHQPKFVAPEKEASLSSSFSQTHIKVLGTIVLLLVVALGYKLFSKPTLRLISPTNNQVLGADELDFQWECNKSGVSFVLEVYEKDTSNLVLRQIIDQQGYKPDTYQQSFFQKDQNYYWIIIPNPDAKQSYNFSAESKYFTINKTVDPPVDPSTVTQEPTDQQQDQQPTEQQQNQPPPPPKAPAPPPIKQPKATDID